MITSIGRDELAKMGAGLPSTYLVQQTGYTIGIAAGEGEPLAAILPAGYLREVEGAKAAVEASMKTRISCGGRPRISPASRT